MSELGELNQRLRKEAETTSNITLSFLGFEHSGLNVQGGVDLASTIGMQLDSAKGPTTLVFENATSTPSGTRIWEKSVNDHGFKIYNTGISLFQRIKRIPSIQEVRRVAASIDSIRGGESSPATAKAINEIIKSELLPLRDLRSYYMGEALDNLRRDYGFDIDQETHKPSVIQREERLSQKAEQLQNISIALWNTHNFEGFLKKERESMEVLAQSARERDQDIANRFKVIVRKLHENSDQGYLGFVFGRSHLNLIESISRKLGPKFIPHMPTCGVSVYGQPIVDIENGVVPSDQAIAQSFFAGMLRGNLEAEAVNRGKMGEIAIEHQTVMDHLDQISALTPLARIRQICEKGESIVSFLRNHPQVGPASNYL